MSGIVFFETFFQTIVYTMIKRRDFVKQASTFAVAFGLLPQLDMINPGKKRFQVSLAQWSYHKALFDGSLTHLDFINKAASLGIHGVEYVSVFFKDQVKNNGFLGQMNTRASDQGVKQLLIMIDGEGGLSETNDKERKKAVENHYKWVEAAKMLGCHSIRVNAYGESEDRNARHSAAVDGLGSLATFASNYDINVIVENHGGLSSEGKWLANVMKSINMPNCGTLPDFGNFCLNREKQGDKDVCVDEYDKYTGVMELLPYAKAVSAKSYDFDAKGNETTIDYGKMIELVRKSKYSGFIGIEYEGNRLSEEEGVKATKALLDRLI